MTILELEFVKKMIQHGKIEELQVFDNDIENEASLSGPSNSTDKEFYDWVKLNYGDSAKPSYMYKAPWANQSNMQYRLERINSYIYGVDSKLMPSLNYSSNNLMRYANEKFEESYVEYRLDGNIYMDQTLGEEIVITPAKTTKTIITYTIVD